MKDIELWCVWSKPKQRFLMRYRDANGRLRQAGTCQSRTRKKAERETLERQNAMNDPKSSSNPRQEITLDEIHERYQRTRLRNRTADYGYQLTAGLKRLKAVAVDRGIERLLAGHIDTEFLAATIELICDEVALATAKSYRTSLRAFFRWAAGLELVRPINWSATSIEGIVESGGRPLTDDEFESMIDEVPKLVGKQRAVEFQNLMRCCYLSGMRLGEALQFHSFRQDCHHVIGGPSPRIRYVSKQKNRKDQVVVMLPEFEQFVATLHPHDDGFYFAPVTRRNVAYTTHKAVGRVIAEIGERAKIVVKHDGHGQPKKYASAHDFRRSCAYRLVSRGYKIFTVQHLMRHADPKTTQQFYSGDMADMVAGEIWGDENELAVEKEVSLRVV